MSNNTFEKKAATIAIEAIFDMDSDNIGDSVKEACRLELYLAVWESQSLDITLESGESVSLEPYFEVIDGGESRCIIGLIEAVYNQALSVLKV